MARIDPNDARYKWFDHALKGAERPALLSANVNYELAGANEWRHEPSLEALESRPLRFYLKASPGETPHALVAEKPAAPMSLTETSIFGTALTLDGGPRGSSFAGSCRRVMARSS